ncbi:MAG: histidinol-phosphate transaminase [Streptococcaceae bacterium]|nr:histidinol-phosphate transaminase [Streptococcaceae bacterium]
MSWKDNLRKVHPYVAGEQPDFMDMIKLNTNENPYPPSPLVTKQLRQFDSKHLRLYPQADVDRLRAELAQYYRLSEQQIFIGNGSDEVLALSFLTFFNSDKPLLMPDISYSFYPVYCDLYDIEYKNVALAEDFRLVVADYCQPNGGIVFANPNAPTGLAINLREIEYILHKNPDSLVLIDEAYVDFGGQSAISLLDKYENLLITRTFSKSRALAGIRLGVALGNEFAISKLYDVKNSFNSYPVDSLAQEIGIASVLDQKYFDYTVQKIISTREWFKSSLTTLGFELTDSKANFVFVKHPKISGKELFNALYDEKIIVRHWQKPRLNDWLRITIGTDDQMKRVAHFLKQYLEERKK